MDLAETIGLPPGSRIEVARGVRGTLDLSWAPTGKSGFDRLVATLFLSGWLGIWTFGGIKSLEMLSDARAGSGTRIFVLCWMCGWAAGEALAVKGLWDLWAARPKCRLELAPGALLFGTTSPPPGQTIFESVVSRRGEEFRYSREEAPPFVLGYAGPRQRLYFDSGARRIEIGPDFSEPEREWLHSLLEKWKSGASLLE